MNCDYIGIFFGKDGEIYWGGDDLRRVHGVNAIFRLNQKNCSGYHVCIKSAYDGECSADYSDNDDMLQNETVLSDKELYVVTYYKYIQEEDDLYNLVDFGITKEDIIQNAANKRYAEGAVYYTMGQMFLATLEYDNADDAD